MSAIDRLEQFAGRPIGGYKEPVDPFLSALKANTSTRPNKHWVTMARMGFNSGARLLINVELGLVSKEGPGKKDELYRKIAAEGVQVRRFATEPGFEHRFASNYFVEEIAESLKLRPQDTRMFLLAMRADLAFDYTPVEPFNTQFVAIAEKYLKDNSILLRPSKRYPVFVELYESWDRKSPVTFYQALYEGTQGSTRRLGGWVPYEVEALQKYYELRAKYGHTVLTLLDEQAIQCQTARQYKQLIKDVRTETGIAVNQGTILLHRNALVYGQPTSGLL